MTTDYRIQNENQIISPALIYYKDIIKQNIKKMIKIAGSAERLWPHVKTYKCSNVIKMLQEQGINKFKCATIAEAEMVGALQADSVVLAYPIVGPNINRFVSLVKKYPDTKFYAISDNLDMLQTLGEYSLEEGIISNVLIDVDMGMERTGVPLNRVKEFHANAKIIKGITMEGMHCYDGNRHESDIDERIENAQITDKQVIEIANNIACNIVIMGGTPSFPCHVKLTPFYVSPGTAIIHDGGYFINFPDLPFIPGAAVLTRVISLPGTNKFTLDLGYKGIAADPAPIRGYLTDFKKAHPILQNEEHWVFKMEEGEEDNMPKVGDTFYVIPHHICPTSALYPSVLVSENGNIVDEWTIDARNRKITL